MLRTRSGLSRPVLRWVSQVAASLGATLAVPIISSAVPHPGSASPPELTSGGKFAARATEAVAYDGLDTMPLPRVVAASAAGALPPAVLRATWEGAPPIVLAPERPARAARPARATTRVEARRAGLADELSSRPVPPADATSVAEATQPTETAPAERGLLASVVPAVAGTARAAWGLTASAGDALVSRVVPQLP